ncbi:M48 family metalloprotease [Rhodobacterales bacterium HKCCE3408]|nr:M48 family metalloprotease [Rhodobacterales bacterium HKCCE3408]
MKGSTAPRLEVRIASSVRLRAKKQLRQGRSIMLDRIRALVAALALFAGALPAAAQSIIRDAEIERGLRELAAPVLAQAGLPRSVRIIVLNDDDLNAFVADAQHIFVTSGLLMQLDSPDQLQAVLAHEAAHIANGHLTSRPAAADRASRGAGLGILAALALGASGNAEAAGGVALGAASTAQRVFFAHSRSEEASADQSALRYMVSAGIDPSAMREVLEIFRGQEVLSAARQDPYVRTHPLTRDRLRAVEAFANGRGGAATGPTTAAQYWYARTTGKLSAFLRNPRWTLRQVGNASDEISILRRAIAHHRNADTAGALSEIGRLLALRPDDPYYQELQGQFLFESRNFGQAVAAYARAVQLAPSEPLILSAYGRALLATETAGNDAQALSVLEQAYARDPANPGLLRDLALAFSRNGNNGMASAVTAERYALQGEFDTAAVHANRAVGLLPNGSPGWRRAQDVLRAAELAADRR